MYFISIKMGIHAYIFARNGLKTHFMFIVSS
jgi:hypothetical protein